MSAAINLTLPSQVVVLAFSMDALRNGELLPAGGAHNMVASRRLRLVPNCQASFNLAVNGDLAGSQALTIQTCHSRKSPAQALSLQNLIVLNRRRSLCEVRSRSMTNMLCCILNIFIFDIHLERILFYFYISLQITDALIICTLFKQQIILRNEYE